MTEPETDPRRQLAIKRLRDRYAFVTHLVSYVVINGMLIAIWALTGAGFFWPVFVLAAWGAGLLIHGYSTFFGEAYTEEQIQKEMSRLPKGTTAP